MESLVLTYDLVDLKIKSKVFQGHNNFYDKSKNIKK